MQFLSKFYPNFVKYNRQWQLLLFGLLILPIIPALGSASLFIIVMRNWQINFNKIKQQRTTFILFILAIWLWFSSLLAYNKEDAFLGLANFLPFFIFFIAIQVMVSEIAHLKVISFTVSFASIFLVILGLGQLYFGWNSSSILDKLIGEKLILNGVPPQRMSSLFLHANLLSFYLTTSFSLTLGLLCSEYLPKFPKFDLIKLFQNFSKPHLNLKTTWLILTLIFDIIGLILTDSRNGWLITFFALIAFSFYYKLYPFLSILTISLISTIWASFGSLRGQYTLRKIIPNFIWQRLSDEMFSDRPFVTLRFTQWDFSIYMIKSKPIFGWGLRNFSTLYETELKTYLGHPHNFFLMFMAETGIIGLFLLMVFVGKILIQGIITLNLLSKNYEEAVILFSYLICFSGYFLFNLFDVSIFDLRSNILGWLILACISGVSESTIKKQKNDEILQK